MPTYEYECPKCGLVFEEFQSITAEPLTKCTTKRCRGKIKRLIGSGSGLLFKGSGFYETDYRSDGYKQAAKAAKESSSTSDNSAKSDKKSDNSKSGGTEGGKKKETKVEKD